VVLREFHFLKGQTLCAPGRTVSVLSFVLGRRRCSNAGGIRGSLGGDIAIKCSWKNADAMRELGDAVIGSGQHRLGGRDVVVGEIWRASSGAAAAPRGGKARGCAPGLSCDGMRPTLQACEKPAALARSLY